MIVRSNFVRWYFNEFSETSMFRIMNYTTEGSPWHREESVGVHTNMVVSEYLLRSPFSEFGEGNWTHETFMGALACVFHDVGKPPCMQNKHSETRGDYKSFHGHESRSARMWEDWAMMPENLEKLQWMCGRDFTGRDIYKVGWMIEHHKPWDVKKEDKLNAMAKTAICLDLVDTFCNVLESDTWGRISDDQEEKRAKVASWISEFRTRVANLAMLDYVEALEDDSIYAVPEYEDPELIIPIGPSGAGKSTVRSLYFEHHEHYSWDDLREEWYLSDEERDNLDADDAYRLAFERSCDDTQFQRRVQAAFRTLLDAKSDIYVDNVNISRKRRAFFINEARRRGYKVVAAYMPCDLMTLIKRQDSRPDKTVPMDVVRQMYNRVQLPQYGEFDHVYVLDHNLPT